MKRLKRIPNFYFTGAITVVDESQRQFYRAAINVLKEFGRVPSEHVGYENSLEWWKANMQGVNARKYDGKGLKKSIALVADITTPTTGGGAEIAEMLAVGVPVQCVYRKGVGVSKYITEWAETAKNLSIELYESVEQLENIVRSFASRVLKEAYMPAGAYFVLEGIDGCGKTTQARLLTSSLQQQGYNTLLIREPGGTQVGERIRAILLDPELKKMSKAAELFLFQTARAELVHEVIRPSLDAGLILVGDRNYLSTIAYQGGGRGFNLDGLNIMNSLAMQRIRPDLALIIEIPLEVSRSRLGVSKDRIEKEGQEFQQRVLEAYKIFAEEEPNTISIPAVVDGRPLDVEKMHQSIKERVDAYLNENFKED